MDVLMRCSQSMPLLVRLAWDSLVVSCFGALLVPELQRWHRYGKLRSTDPGDPASSGSFLDRLTVNKRLFGLFYVEGLLVTLALLASKGQVLEGPLDRLICSEDSPAKGVFSNFHPLPLVLMAVQCTRRLAEEAKIPPSSAQMHVGGFLVGAAYYVLVPITLAMRARRQDDVNSALLALGLAVFAYGSRHQAKCHAILLELRIKSKTYAIPRGDWFELCSNPHYFAEIVIYVGLVLVVMATSEVNNMDLVRMLGFINLNLTITGYKTHEWYMNKFGSDYSSLGRKVIFPYVF